MLTLLKEDRDGWRSDFAEELAINAFLKRCGFESDKRALHSSKEDLFWCKAKCNFGNEIFFSLANGAKSTSLDSTDAMHSLLTFLSELDEGSQNKSFTVSDFGYWSPPEYLNTWSVQLNIGGKKREIFFALPAQNWREQAELYHQEKVKPYESAVVHRELLIRCAPSEEDITTRAFLYRGSTLSKICKLVKKSEEWILMIEENENTEEEIVMDSPEHALEGELSLGTLTFSLDDYLALEPGDEIEISSNSTLYGVFRVGGLTVATGEVSFETGKLRLQLKNSIQQ